MEQHFSKSNSKPVRPWSFYFIPVGNDSKAWQFKDASPWQEVFQDTYLKFSYSLLVVIWITCLFPQYLQSSATIRVAFPLPSPRYHLTNTKLNFHSTKQFFHLLKHFYSVSLNFVYSFPTSNPCFCLSIVCSSTMACTSLLMGQTAAIQRTQRAEVWSEKTRALGLIDYHLSPRGMFIFFYWNCMEW